jgi:gliding motility-associated-like protein
MRIDLTLLPRILASFFLLLSLDAVSQVNNVVIDNGTFYSCGGAFFDSGGQGGPGYQNNEYFVCTICPETEGDVVTVDFITFTLDETGNQNTWDYIAIYDGDNTAAAPLGVYTGNDLQGLFVTATSQNTSGCLTFVFDSNAEGTGNFGGSITCDTPCDRPIAVATYDAPDSHRICVGDVINFDGSASTAAAGFLIIEYLWDFADGTTDNSGPIVSHSWDEPGEYVIELYLTDDNGCASTNRVSLQVLVATYPTWSPFPGDALLCLGEELCLEAIPDDYEQTWSGPEQTYENADLTVLPDDVGACNPSEINVTGFAPGQTLTNVNDLFSVDISLNHSFLFDLVITVICPNGQSTVLHQQMQQPVGADVGANGTDLGIPDGAYWDYAWTPDATQGTWSQVATLGNDPSLPEGEYNSLDPLDQLVGCELNGTWQLEICDLWGGDDGEMNSWGLEFNPAIIPDVTEFTPTIGEYSDSSFWSLPVPGPTILSQSADGNEVCIFPEIDGVWDFTYTVANNHGCSYDSTVTVTAELAAQADAGPDVTYCGNGTTLQGGLQGQPTPLCSSVGGNYSYCYADNVDSVFTFCPDNPGDGYTFIDVSFNAGSVENFFDEFWVYDGNNTGAPLLAGPIYGSLAGMSWVATNPTGCLTFLVTPDGSVSCQSGSQEEWNWDVGCSQGGPQFVWQWTPDTGLSDPSIPNPEVTVPPNAELTYILATYPLGHPDCISYDEMTLIPGYEYEVDFFQPYCFGPDGWIEVFVDPDSGTGPWDLELWQDGIQTEVTSIPGGIVNFPDLYPDTYTVLISDGSCVHEEIVDMSTPPQITLELTPDTTICVGGMATLVVTPSFDTGDLYYYWSTGDQGVEDFIEVNTTTESTYEVHASFGLGCETESVITTVNMYEPFSLGLLAGETICLGDSAFVGIEALSGGLEPYGFSWEGNDGSTSVESGFWAEPEETTEYCLTVTDVCETPSLTECTLIEMTEPIDPTFEADTLGGCLPVTINFYGNAESTNQIASSIWNFGDGVTWSQIGYSGHTYLDEGIWDISLTIVSVDGCVFSHTDTALISTFKYPFAEFAADPYTAVLPHTEVEFTNYSLDYIESEWLFNNSGTSDEDSPSYEFPSETAGSYPVTLTVTNEWGCQDSITHFVLVVEDFVLYAPNAFTPDEDGLNDVFAVHGIDVDETDYHIQIFNRWGEVVFSSYDIHQVWDGSHQNGGYYVGNEVYLYRIVTRSATTQDRKEIMGHITMMR